MSNLPGLPDDHDINHLKGALRILKEKGWQFTAALDGGAHRGIWSREMANWFNDVYAFEANPETMKLFDAPGNVHASFTVLGDPPRLPATKDTFCTQRQYFTMEDGPDNTGQFHIVKEIPYSRDLKNIWCTKAIDGLDFINHKNIDFIKLDVEGYELFALKGARNTIEKRHPAIMVELNGLSERYGHTDQDVRDWLESRGYEQEGKWNKDYLFVWSGRE